MSNYSRIQQPFLVSKQEADQIDGLALIKNAQEKTDSRDVMIVVQPGIYSDSKFIPMGASRRVPTIAEPLSNLFGSCVFATVQVIAHYNSLEPQQLMTREEFLMTTLDLLERQAQRIKDLNKNLHAEILTTCSILSSVYGLDELRNMEYLNQEMSSALELGK